MTQLRVILADDSALLRAGLARLLTDHEVAVVGEAANVPAVLDLVGRHRPDVAVLDIRMPPTHTDEGIKAAATIRANHPGVGVLVLSQYLQTAAAVALLEHAPAGVGYLLKDRIIDIGEIIDALHRIARREVVVDPAVVARLVQHRRHTDPIARLAARELQVLELVTAGRSNQAIADRLAISDKTVETYVRNIFQKLDLVESPDDNRRVLAALRYLRSTTSRAEA